MMRLKLNWGHIGVTSAIVLIAGNGGPTNAQNSKAASTSRCDTARALGHIKRIAGISSDVTIERANGGIVRQPAALTPICAADRVKVRNNSQAIIDIYNAPAVNVTKIAPWTAPTLTRQSSVTGNVWAFFVDKLAPDVGRVQTQQRTRGPASGPPKVQIAGVASQNARLSIEELGAELYLPIAGWALIETVQLEFQGTNVTPIAGQIAGQGAPQSEQTPVLTFPTAGLSAGSYIIKARLSAGSTDQNVSRDKILGGFDLIVGKAQTLGTTDAPTPYDGATTRALQALWLAQSNPEVNGLMAYQISQSEGSEALPRPIVQRLILNYARP